MQESKIVATKRLQDEGHWNEASLYREGIRETLRSEGMTRKEASRVAWEKMLEVFPPFDAEEEAAHWLCACYFPPAEAEHEKAELRLLFFSLFLVAKYRVNGQEIRGCEYRVRYQL